MNRLVVLPRVLAGILVCSALLFWAGSSAERIGEGPPNLTAATSPTSTTARQEQESRERGATAEPPNAAEPHESPEQTQRERAEALGGVNLESLPLRLGAVISSVVVATLLWFWPAAGIYVVAAAFAAVFAVLDGRELVFQLGRNRALLVGISGVLLLLHAGAAALAVRLLMPERSRVAVA